ELIIRQLINMEFNTGPHVEFHLRGGSGIQAAQQHSAVLRAEAREAEEEHPAAQEREVGVVQERRDFAGIVRIRYGVDGHSCILKALCEAKQILKPGRSLVEDILDVTFT
ncbi:hypothetical protein ANN_20574, partial [Periplaneta americana]